MARILVTESIAEGGLDRLRAAGHTVDVQLDLTPDTLLGAIVGANALIIRSATQVTAEVLEVGTDLVVVGRAGIGLDNVDVPAATDRGVMVVNAPQSNIISAAEHTMALLLSQARNVPQAHAALVAGRWERSKWEGVELADKTLGIVGLGRIGKLVADRAKAFQMRLVAYDPFVSAERAKQMGVELLTLDQIIEQSDFLTIHLPKTKETAGLINRDLLAEGEAVAARHQRGARRHRGRGRPGRVHPRRRDRRRRARCVRQGARRPSRRCSSCRRWWRRRTSAPPPARPRTRPGMRSPTWCSWRWPATSCRGPSTSMPPRRTRTCGRSSPLAERLGRLYGSLHRSSPDSFELLCQGDIARYDTRILGLAVLKGFFGRLTDDPVSYVNAPSMAKAAGIAIREVNSTDTDEYVNLITLRCTDHHSISGTLTGRRREQRIVEIDGHTFDVPPSDHMLVITNDDRPGVIGTVGTILGEALVNIADMDVGRVADAGTAVMLIATTTEVDESVQAELRHAPGILSVIDLQG